MEFKTHKNTISAYGTIAEGDGLRFEQALSELSNKQNEVIVRVHTYGGNVFEGNWMCNALANCTADVELHVVGVAASMGAILTLYCEKVMIVENGFLMIHAPHSNTFGTAQELESTAQLLRSIENNFIQKLSQKTKKDEASLRSWITQDTWFNAQQALQAGLVSGIIEAEIKTEDLNPEAEGLQKIYAQFEPLINKLNSNNQNNIKMEQQQTTTLQEASASVQHYKDKCRELQAQLDAITELQVDELIAEAKRSKHITETVEATLREVAQKSGVSSLKVILSTLPKHQSLSAQIRNPNENDRWTWSYKEWQQNDPQGLEQRAKEDPQWFEELSHAWRITNNK